MKRKWPFVSLVTLRNNFHETEARVWLPASGVLSRLQYRRVRRALCNISTCQCGKVRGPQEVHVEPEAVDGRSTYRLIAGSRGPIRGAVGSPTSADPVKLLDTLDADRIQDRLEELEREQRALRVLLRSARARQSQRDRHDRGTGAEVQS